MVQVLKIKELWQKNLKHKGFAGVVLEECVSSESH